MSAPPPIRRFWTTPEVKIVRDHYSTLGPHDVLAMLPGRTLSGVYQRARILGLRSAKCPDKRRKLGPPTPEIDAAIAAFYANPIKAGDILRLAERLGRPHFWITKRAGALGVAVPRIKELPWSAPEVAILEAHAHLSPAVISRTLARHGFRRSTTAVVIKCRRLQFDTTDPDHFCANQLGLLFGVDRKTVTRWIESEGLKAERRGTARTEAQGGDMWRISRKNLRAWIPGHAQLIDLRKVDRFWFLDFAFGNGK